MRVCGMPLLSYTPHMSIDPESLKDWLTLPCDCLIDVRSPGEFAADHVPGALNLPVLSDDERREVGTVYSRESRFRARRIGAAMMARRTAGHLETVMAEWPGSHRLAVYCWRGGLRSEGFVDIVRRVGWRAAAIDGGYRNFRRRVSDLLYRTSLPFSIMLVDGGTGVGKTKLLKASERRGVQIIDLEGLANHRGSFFGDHAAEQPSQKAFESALATRIVALDPMRPVLMEAESSRIGRIILPPALWQAMCTAPRIWLSATIDERAAHILRHYSPLCEDSDRLNACLDGLQPYHSKTRLAGWREAARAGDFSHLVKDLIRHHYDPRYRHRRDAELAIPLTRLNDRGIDVAVTQVIAFLDRR